MSALVDAGVVQGPSVSIVTEAGSADADALRITAASLLGQSLQSWSWDILSSVELVAPVNDPRVRVVHAEVRAAAIGRVFSESRGDLALVEPGVALLPTSLEKWAWYLDSRPPAAGAAGARRGVAPGEPFLLRRDRVRLAGGIDPACATLDPAEIGLVPFTGSTSASGDSLPEPHVWLPPSAVANAWISDSRPFHNRLAKTADRVLLIAPWMVVGGADKFNLDLIEGLRGAGWEISVATTIPVDHRLFPAYAKHTQDLFPLAHFLELVDYPRFLAYLIESRGFDVVLVSNSELGYRLLPYLRAHCPAPAYLDFCHSEAEHWYEGGYPRLSVEYQDVLDLTVTASAHLRRWMGDHGADVERVEVCYANVDADAFGQGSDVRARVRAGLRIDDGIPVILFVGRVSEDKQPDVLMATIRRLSERGLSFTLLVVGDGPDLPRMRRFFRLHRLGDSVRFAGEVEHEQIPQYYAAADVLFLPSRSEGVALAVYEAMAAGVPVVTAAVGGQAELVAPETGVLVPRGTSREEAERYSDALAALLRDPDRRTEMGRAARLRINERFRLEKMVERMDDLLREAMRLRDEKPRQGPSHGLARAVATEAIELTRGSLTSMSRGDGAVRSYLLLQRVGGSVYRRAVAFGVPGLPQLRDRLRRRLMGF